MCLVSCLWGWVVLRGISLRPSVAGSDLTRWRQDEPLGLSFRFGDCTDNTKTFYIWVLVCFIKTAARIAFKILQLVSKTLKSMNYDSFYLASSSNLLPLTSRQLLHLFFHLWCRWNIVTIISGHLNTLLPNLLIW
jgi:hypothetical protein